MKTFEWYVLENYWTDHYDFFFLIEELIAEKVYGIWSIL